jgi:hypothetical protein
MQLVSAAAGMAPPPGADDGGAGGAAGSSDGGDGSEAGDASKAAGALGSGTGGGDAQRWRDQERRNQGLREELTRQRVAFKVGIRGRGGGGAPSNARQGAC